MCILYIYIYYVEFVPSLVLLCCYFLCLTGPCGWLWLLAVAEFSDGFTEKWESGRDVLGTSGNTLQKLKGPKMSKRDPTRDQSPHTKPPKGAAKVSTLQKMSSRPLQHDENHISYRCIQLYTWDIMRLRINVCICNPTWIVSSTSPFRACHGLLAESCPGASCEDRTFDEVGVWKPLGKK